MSQRNIGQRNTRAGNFTGDKYVAYCSLQSRGNLIVDGPATLGSTATSSLNVGTISGLPVGSDICITDPIQIDEIKEKTGGAGVCFPDTIKADAIEEKNTGLGAWCVTDLSVNELKEKNPAAGICVSNQLKADDIVEKTPGSGVWCTTEMVVDKLSEKTPAAGVCVDDALKVDVAEEKNVGSGDWTTTNLNVDTLTQGPGAAGVCAVSQFLGDDIVEKNTGSGDWTTTNLNVDTLTQGPGAAGVCAVSQFLGDDIVEKTPGSGVWRTTEMVVDKLSEKTPAAGVCVDDALKVDVAEEKNAGAGSWTTTAVNVDQLNQGPSAAGVCVNDTLKVDVITELTGAAGVCVAPRLRTDVIAEKTGSAGVTIEAGSDFNVDTINSNTTGNVTVCDDLELDVIKGKTVFNQVTIAGVTITDGVIPIGALSAQPIILRGCWNATSGTTTDGRTIVSGGYSSGPAAIDGDYYLTNVAGALVIDGHGPWSVGDAILFKSGSWERLDNVTEVVSVNGMTGAVVLATTDLSDVNAVAATTAGETLRWDGVSEFTASKLATTDLSDFDSVPATVAAQVPRWDGASEYVPTILPTVDLSDVSASATLTNQLLIYDSGTSKYIPGFLTVGKLGNVAASADTAADCAVLKYNLGAGEYQGANLITRDLADVSSVVATVGKFLRHDGSEYTPVNIVAADVTDFSAAFMTEFSGKKTQDLMDVSGPLGAAGTVLRSNGSVYIPTTLAVTDMSDVASVPAPVLSDVLIWDGATTYAPGKLAIENLSNVTGTPANKEVLVYNSGSGEYQPGVPALDDYTLCGGTFLCAALAAGQYIKYNGANWINTSFATDFMTEFSTKDTDDLSEGATNLYYTDSRVSANSDVASNTAHTATVTGNPHMLSTDDLTDVGGAATSVGEFLLHDGSDLKPADFATEVDTVVMNTTAKWNADKLQGTPLDAVSIPAASADDKLVWDGAKWIAKSVGIVEEATFTVDLEQSGTTIYSGVLCRAVKYNNGWVTVHLDQSTSTGLVPAGAATIISAAGTPVPVGFRPPAAKTIYAPVRVQESGTRFDGEFLIDSGGSITIAKGIGGTFTATASNGIFGATVSYIHA